MKQLFYIKPVVVALLLLCTQAAIAANYNFQADDIYYKINADSITLTVVYGDSDYVGDITVPAYVDYNNKTYKVTTIAERAFSWCYDLVGLHLPSTITSIGREALGNSHKVVSLTVDSDNRKFDSRDNCNAIIETNTNKLVLGCATTVIPNTVVSIGEYAFARSAIAAADLPSSVTTLCECAYYWCDSITEVILPNTVTSIGDDAFDACWNLTTVYIPESVRYIGHGAFSDSQSLVSVTVNPQNPYYDSRNNCNAIIETATNTLITGCKNTIIPDDVQIIAESAFYNCGLKEITIPPSVTLISSNAFRYDPIKDLVIPGSVKEIQYSAFYACHSLTNLTLEEGIEKLGTSVFEDCYFFLKDVTIPNSVKTIGSRAFRNCWKLQNLTIGSGVQSIYSEAFKGCRELTSIRCLATQPPYASSFDSICYADAILRVPYMAIEDYKTANVWKNFAHILGLYSGAVFEVDGIYYYATSDSTASVTSIPDESYYYSGDIVIPENVPFQEINFTVEGIRDNAFDGCFELSSVVIPNSVTDIGTEAFQGCSGLTSVTIGAGVSSIGAKAFNYCNALTSVTCLPTVPPTMESANCFTTNCYRNATLSLQRTCMDLYQEADYWNRFVHISGFGTAGPGDTNGDGAMDVDDISYLISYLMGNDVGSFYSESADLDGSGNIDIDDVTILISMILNQ